MEKLIKKPLKSIFFLAITFILASVMHNAVYAATKVEEPFFFIIAIVSAFSIPIVLIYSLIQKVFNKGK